MNALRYEYPKTETEFSKNKWIKKLYVQISLYLTVKKEKNECAKQSSDVGTSKLKMQ